MKLPPFGNILLAYQKDHIPLEPTIYIFMGKNASRDAKNQLKMGTLATYLPYGEDFTHYEWPIKDQKVILTDSDFITIPHFKRFALHLVKSHPRILFISSTVHKIHELISDTENFYVG